MTLVTAGMNTNLVVNLGTGARYVLKAKLLVYCVHYTTHVSTSRLEDLCVALVVLFPVAQMRDYFQMRV